MIKQILIFFLALQLLVIVAVIWFFSRDSDGALNWTQEAWRRMNDDHKQHCFDVVKESNALGDAPYVKLLSGEQVGDRILVHYRIEQTKGKFQEYVYECTLVNGKVDKAYERKQMLNENFSDIATQLQ